MPNPIQLNGAGVDLSRRIKTSAAVAASPAAGTITTICTLTITEDLAVTAGVLLVATASYTVGTNGVTALFQIRQTNTTGGIIAATGADTVVATNLRTMTLQGFDTAPVIPGQVYVLCLTVGSGSASSAVASAQLVAIVI